MEMNQTILRMANVRQDPEDKVTSTYLNLDAELSRIERDACNADEYKNALMIAMLLKSITDNEVLRHLQSFIMKSSKLVTWSEVCGILGKLEMEREEMDKRLIEITDMVDQVVALVLSPKKSEMSGEKYCVVVEETMKYEMSSEKYCVVEEN